MSFKCVIIFTDEYILKKKSLKIKLPKLFDEDIREKKIFCKMNCLHIPFCIVSQFKNNFLKHL